MLDVNLNILQEGEISSRVSIKYEEYLKELK